MRIAGRGLALLLLMMIFAMPGRGESALRPGLRASWRIELLAEGKRSRDRLSLEVLEEREPGLFRLEISHSGDLYRILYRDGGDLPHFSPDRVSDLQHFENGEWVGRGSDDLDMLNHLVLMELRLQGAEQLGDTLQQVSGREFACQRFLYDDSGENLQEGPAVSLHTEWTVSGEVWVSPEIPLTGWLLYREVRRTRKTSQIGSQSFEGEEESGVTEWVLDEWRSP